jgi:hypothetical protein
MLSALLADDVALSANDSASIEQIQRELKRRSDERRWGFSNVN